LRYEKTMADNLFEIRLAGKGIAPGTVKSRDLAEIIASIEDMVAAVINQDRPDIGKDQIIVGLSDITEGTLRLHFSSPVAGIVFPAYLKITSSINGQNFHQLPTSSVESLRKLTAFSRKRNCNLEFRTQNGKAHTLDTLAIITPNTLIEPDPIITGNTTIYGEIIRVGGVKSRVLVRLANGKIIRCEFQRGIARRLGERLYTWVGLEGVAKWNAREYSIEEFTVTDLLEFESGSVVEAFSALKQLAGHYFNDIDDPDDYVNEMRRDDTEE
jgi:hypothetical protein